MEIVGNHIQSMNRLNVAITNIYPTKSGLGIGIQRLDGKPDERFAKFHQTEMTGADIKGFIADAETLKWEPDPTTSLENKSKVIAGDYVVELFSVMRHEQAVKCLAKILGGQAH